MYKCRHRVGILFLLTYVSTEIIQKVTVNLQGQEIDYVMGKCTLNFNIIVTASWDIANKSHNIHQNRKSTRKNGTCHESGFQTCRLLKSVTSSPHSLIFCKVRALVFGGLRTWDIMGHERTQNSWQASPHCGPSCYGELKIPNHSHVFTLFLDRKPGTRSNMWTSRGRKQSSGEMAAGAHQVPTCPDTP